MKKKYLLNFLIFILTIISFNCDMMTFSKSENSSNYSQLSLSVSINSRMLNPTQFDFMNEEINQDYSIVLMGKKTNSSEETYNELKTWTYYEGTSAYQNMRSEKNLSILKDTWDFILEVKNTGKPELSFYLENKKIDQDSESLCFSYTSISDSSLFSGKIDISLVYDNIDFIDQVEYTITSIDPNQNPITGVLSSINELKLSDISSGFYNIAFEFYQEINNSLVKVGTWMEIVNVYPCSTTKGSISISDFNKLYLITLKYTVNDEETIITQTYNKYTKVKLPILNIDYWQFEGWHKLNDGNLDPEEYTEWNSDYNMEEDVTFECELIPLTNITNISDWNQLKTTIDYFNNLESDTEYSISLNQENYVVDESIEIKSNIKIMNQNSTPLTFTRDSSFKEEFFIINDDSKLCIESETDNSIQFIGNDNGNNAFILCNGNLDLSNCNFSDNNSVTNGGAINLDTDGSVLLKDCIFTDNSCENGKDIFQMQNNFYSRKYKLNEIDVYENEASIVNDWIGIIDSVQNYPNDIIILNTDSIETQRTGEFGSTPVYYIPISDNTTIISSKECTISRGQDESSDFFDDYFFIINQESAIFSLGVSEESYTTSCRIILDGRSNIKSDYFTHQIINTYGTVNLYDVTIQNNYYDYPDGPGGAAVYVYSDAVLNINNGCIIQNNISNQDGGGIYAEIAYEGYTNPGKIVMNDGIIRNNKTEGEYTYGGGICTYGELIIKSGKIYNNSSYRGGGLYVNTVDKDVTLGNVKIYNNIAGEDVDSYPENGSDVYFLVGNNIYLKEALYIGNVYVSLTSDKYIKISNLNPERFFDDENNEKNSSLKTINCIDTDFGLFRTTPLFVINSDEDGASDIRLYKDYFNLNTTEYTILQNGCLVQN